MCQSARPRSRTVVSAKGKTAEVGVCRECGYVANPKNLHDYTMYESADKLPMRARVGTPDRQGREFHMAAMAADILGRSRLSVLVYGAGRSRDNLHINDLAAVRSVAISDLMNIRDDAEFVDTSGPIERRFDIVIASEVVEHFLTPRQDFAALLGLCSSDGVVVCSTNIYDGGSLRSQPYLFIPGHTSYYSPESLLEIARLNQCYVDFRVPLVATGYGGPRKRYVLFSRSPGVMQNIVRYFGSHMFAPSEGPRANAELAREVSRFKRSQAAVPAGD